MVFIVECYCIGIPFQIIHWPIKNDCLPTFDGKTPVMGSGCGPPVITPGTAVGIGYGQTVGGLIVVPGWGAGVGMYVHLGTWQHASFGSITMVQPEPKLL